MNGAEILTIALGLAMAGALLLWRIQSDYCSKCAHCRFELAEKARVRAEVETKRQAQQHQWFHKTYGDESCPDCKGDE